MARPARHQSKGKRGPSAGASQERLSRRNSWYLVQGAECRVQGLRRVRLPGESRDPESLGERRRPSWRSEQRFFSCPAARNAKDANEEELSHAEHAKDARVREKNGPMGEVSVRCQHEGAVRLTCATARSVRSTPTCRRRRNLRHVPQTRRLRAGRRRKQSMRDCAPGDLHPPR